MSLTGKITCVRQHGRATDSSIRLGAEREGFEPSIRVTTDTRFPSVLLQPLGHLSCHKIPCDTDLRLLLEIDFDTL